MCRLYSYAALLFVLFSIMGICGFAQTEISYGCGDDSIMELQRRLIPDYDKRIADNNLILREYIKRNLSQKTDGRIGLNGGTGLPADSFYTIPVVIHIIYPSGEAYGSGTNISYAQIRSQLEALNAAFSKSYPNYNGQSHPSYAQNAKIRFCLARISTPAGLPWAQGPGGTEYGVLRYPDNAGAYNHLITIASASQLLAITHPNNTSFPFDKYLNIWLVKSIAGGNTVMGYAPKPLMGGYPLDGIVLRADIFGDNTTGGNYPLGFNLTQGKILVHEMGHYLNLYHIFQGGCAGSNGPGANADACDLNGDYICDIKPCTTQNVLCNSGNYNTCTPNYDPGTTMVDMINDYMSYADDDCMNTFTLNQVQRMQASLHLQRQNLWQASNLAATGVLGNAGCVPAYLNATINASEGVFCAGTPIHFSNPVSGNTAIRYQWQFPGTVAPLISNRDTVTVTYNIPGNYKVILTVSDGIKNLTDSLSFSVVTCQLDSSLQYMAHWYFGDYCSIDFSSGAPVKTTIALNKGTIHGESAYSGQLPYIAATISLSDSSGKLLFYSNGVSVWDGSHKKISGSPIFGVSDINASTGLCYIPYPGQSNKYYMVGVYPDFDGKPSGIRYVLVDLAANTVTPYQEFQHSLLPKRFAEHLTIVPHCNGTDYWIIARGNGNDNNTNFYALLVSSAGIDVNQAPVISTGFSYRSYGGGGVELKANRSGDRLILSQNLSEAGALYDFDSRTGEVKNEKIIPSIQGYQNVQSGVAFSPNGDYFYLIRTSNFTTGGQPYWLFQYRVSDFRYNILPTNGFYYGPPFQLGPDNQLYIINGANYLARLSNPDSWGGASFDDRFISFAESSNSMRIGTSLPAYIDARRKEPIHPDFKIQKISCQNYQFSALCFDSYTATWDFGDSSGNQTGHTITHNYTKPGEFTITLTLSSATKTFGFVSKRITILPQSIEITGPDSICNTSNFETQYFSKVIPNVNYKWSASYANLSGPDNLPYVGVSWPQSASFNGVVIQLVVFTADGCFLNAMKTVVVKQGPVFNWILQDSICHTDKPLILNASPSGGIFSGPGVGNGIFSPDSAGVGYHILNYRYGTGSICYSEIQKTIQVINNCTVSVPPVSGGSNGTAIPNVFSPNGDGINDTWRIKYLDNFPNAMVDVYNRYGQLVFHSIGYSKNWDGKSNGKDLPVGTYYYLIVAGPNTKPLSGSISILR